MAATDHSTAPAPLLKVRMMMQLMHVVGPACTHRGRSSWLLQENGVGTHWHQHIHSLSNMLQLSYQNKQPMTPSAFFDQLAQQVCPAPCVSPPLQPPASTQILRGASLHCCSRGEV